MSNTGRQKNLFLAEDWKRVYQSFKNADFTSYDFENLRRVMINYLRENYPEDFNDYIESSEYLALIDLIAYLGQNLAFRMDLNARENFLELAERRESVIRLARMLSYNVKRNIAANGLLKVDSVTTSEEVIDSAGRDLKNIEVSWNDPTNTNWFDQFIKIMNASMSNNLSFGIPQKIETVSDIYTEQYQLNSNLADTAIFPFTKTVDGRGSIYEIVSTVVSNGSIKEDTPKKGQKVSLLYRDDSKGYGSINTGWFFHFRQGTLNNQDFTILSPTTNQIVEINANGINDDDVWLYSIDSLNSESELWTKVPELVGSNIIYNNLGSISRKP